MTKNDLFLGSNVLISIKATHEVQDEGGVAPIKRTKGELVLTEKEVMFLEVKGLFRKEKKRVHAFPVGTLVGYSYESWGSGPVSLYLATSDRTAKGIPFVYICSKGDVEKFIGRIKQHGFF